VARRVRCRRAAHHAGREHSENQRTAANLSERTPCWRAAIPRGNIVLQAFEGEQRDIERLPSSRDSTGSLHPAVDNDAQENRRVARRASARWLRAAGPPARARHPRQARAAEGRTRRFGCAAIGTPYVTPSCRTSAALSPATSPSRIGLAILLRWNALADGGAREKAYGLALRPHLLQLCEKSAADMFEVASKKTTSSAGRGAARAPATSFSTTAAFGAGRLLARGSSKCFLADTSRYRQENRRPSARRPRFVSATRNPG